MPTIWRRLRMEDVIFLDIAGSHPMPAYELVFAYSNGNDNPAVQSFLNVALRMTNSSAHRARRGSTKIATQPEAAHGP